MDNYILITGNVVDGLVFFDPFDNVDDAHDWAIDNIYVEWIVAEVQPVTEERYTP